MIPELKGSLTTWADTAAPGERVIVQTADHNRHPEAEALRNAGLITTTQKRAYGHAFHLIAVKLRHRRKPEREPIGRGNASRGQA
jgi:hypothetical protein